MLIGEICRECNLTKKAVEYYEQQGLIKPEISPNGYRVYSEADAALLREIAILRKLDLSIPEIRVILESPDKCQALENLKSKMNMHIHQIKARMECVDHLIASNYNLAESESYIGRQLDENEIIKVRLERAFPGNYGLFLCLHFGRFLNEKIDSAEKAAAFNNIISFLDHVENIEIPEDLTDLLNEVYGGMEAETLEQITQGNFEAIANALDHTDEYLEANRSAIADYLQYRTSDDYKNSPIGRLQQLLLEFQRSSGYYDILIPNLKILSQSYRSYQEKLHAANERFLRQFPDAQKLAQSLERDAQHDAQADAQRDAQPDTQSGAQTARAPLQDPAVDKKSSKH